MLRVASLILCLIGVANFVAFFVIALAIGGDAMNGRGRRRALFFKQSRKDDEVNQALYTYSLWHVRSLFVTQPLAMLAGWFWQKNRNQLKQGEESD